MPRRITSWSTARNATGASGRHSCRPEGSRCAAPGTRALVSGGEEEQTVEGECPHSQKPFAGEPIEGGRAARYLGFKCPHCKLFVPLQRATAPALSRAPAAAS